MKETMNINRNDDFNRDHSGTDEQRDTLVTWLKDAYAMEQGIISEEQDMADWLEMQSSIY
jgi:hypothetical protein